VSPSPARPVREKPSPALKNDFKNRIFMKIIASPRNFDPTRYVNTVDDHVVGQKVDERVF
jgi:hypothetical protein